MRSNITGARLSNMLLMERNRKGVAHFASTGTAIALDADMPPLLTFDLTGATNVKLPAAAAVDKGLEFTVINVSTGAVSATFQSSTGGALTLQDILAQGLIGRLVTDGTSWYTQGLSS